MREVGWLSCTLLDKIVRSGDYEKAQVLLSRDGWVYDISVDAWKKNIPTVPTGKETRMAKVVLALIYICLGIVLYDLFTKLVLGPGL